jgi:hypothetical protein
MNKVLGTFYKGNSKFYGAQNWNSIKDNNDNNKYTNNNANKPIDTSKSQSIYSHNFTHQNYNHISPNLIRIQYFNNYLEQFKYRRNLHMQDYINNGIYNVYQGSIDPLMERRRDVQTKLNNVRNKLLNEEAQRIERWMKKVDEENKILDDLILEKQYDVDYNKNKNELALHLMENFDDKDFEKIYNDKEHKKLEELKSFKSNNNESLLVLSRTHSASSSGLDLLDSSEDENDKLLNQRNRNSIIALPEQKKEKNEKNENDENDNNCLTNIRLTNKIYENFYNNVKKISDYCEDINNFTEIELLNDEKKEENKNLIDEENEEEEEKKEKKYSYLNSLQKKYKNKIMDKVSIYHKIIIYISYLLNYNMNFVEKEEEEKKKRKQKELYSVFIEDDEQMFENIESNKWDSLFYPEYKHIIRSLNTKSVLREFLFDKYFYYVFRINTNFEKFLTNYSNPKDKPNYLTDNRFNVERVPRYSKLTFSETIIGIEKSDLFMIPSCLSRINKRIYNTIPFEFNDTNINRELINDIFTKFAGIKIYDIFIKYFYLPNSNNTIDNEIYLGYYLYQIYKKNNQKRTMNLSKEIPKYEIEKFYKKIEYLMNNNILIKNNENFITFI